MSDPSSKMPSRPVVPGVRDGGVSFKGPSGQNVFRGRLENPGFPGFQPFYSFWCAGPWWARIGDRNGLRKSQTYLYLGGWHKPLYLSLPVWDLLEAFFFPSSKVKNTNSPATPRGKPFVQQSRFIDLTQWGSVCEVEPRGVSPKKEQGEFYLFNFF